VSKIKNNILVVIILLIFTGQVAASSIVLCSMQESSIDTMADHFSFSEISHTSHDMPHSSNDMNKVSHGMDHKSSSSHDCCSDNSSCSMAGCILLALPVTLQLKTPNLIQRSVISEFFMATSQVSSSLYRPPILS